MGTKAPKDTEKLKKESKGINIIIINLSYN